MNDNGLCMCDDEIAMRFVDTKESNKKNIRMLNKGNRQTPTYGEGCNNKYDDNGIKPIPQLPYTVQEEHFIQLN